ncbi:MAG: hypothetical protein RL701_1053 [Pseudomonadota bacterium]
MSVEPPATFDAVPRTSNGRDSARAGRAGATASGPAQRLLERFDGASARQAWLCIGALLCVVGVHLSTLTLSPPHWQDECQIVDWGRATIFEPNTHWSVNMLDDGRNVPMLPFVGPALQELAYRALAPNPIGTRLATLFAAAGAVSCFFVWLKRRGGNSWESLLASGLLFLDTVFTSSYRGARVDAWALLACFGSLALLRGGVIRKSLTSGRVMAVGAGLTLAPFIWPSATMLAPIAIAEFYSVAFGTPHARKSDNRTRLLRLLRFAAIGGAALALVVLGFLYWRNPNAFALASTMVRSQFGNRPQTVLERANACWITFRSSPVAWLAALFLVLRLPDRATMAATGCVLVVLLSSLLYSHRVLYLMPYAAWIVAEALRNLRVRRNTSRPAWAVLVLLGCGAAMATLGLRTVLALEQRAGRDPAQLLPIAQHYIGAKKARVYLEEFAFYFAGRQLGWEIIRAYGNTNGYAPIFSDVDYAIVHTGGEYEAHLLKDGLRIIGKTEAPRLSGKSWLSHLSVGAQPYGSYTFLAGKRTFAPAQ